MQMIVPLLVFALEASAASEFRILSACDESAELRVNIQQDTQLQIHSSVSGGSLCYSVTATVEGKQVHGYVIDGRLDSVVAFEKEKTKFLRSTLSVPLGSPSPPNVTPQAQSETLHATEVDTAKPAKEVPIPHKQPIISD